MRLTLSVYLGVFALFLAASVLLTYQHQKRTIYDEYEVHQRSELHLMGLLAREAMFQEDYALIEWFVKQWGKEQPDVLALRAVAANGFEIAHYQKAGMSENRLTIDHEVNHAGRPLLRFELTLDRCEMDPLLSDLFWQLVWGAAAVMLLLSFSVWFVLRRLAIRPLEKEVQRRKKAEDQLRSFYEQNQLLLESAGEGIFSVDSDGVCTYVNDTALSLLGYAHSQVMGKQIYRLVCSAGREEGQPSSQGQDIMASVSHGEGLRVEEGIFWRSDGTQFPVRYSSFPLIEQGNRITGAVIVFHDITEQKSQKELLQHQAAHDPLTGLVNRREFERRLERALETAKSQVREHALLYMDLDKFKPVNDSAGHQAGDEVLRGVAALMSRCVRDRDTLARIGGDEFGALLEHCTMNAAMRIAKDISIAVCSHQFPWKESNFRIGVSIGVVVVDDQSSGVEELLDSADSACYMAKQLGGCQVQVGVPGSRMPRSVH
jgi:diguanylate cyclase (GGDEF)-like protein/PAS domain S-box-containing protein